MIAQATKKRWGVNEIFEYAADLEEKDRACRGLERRTRLARLEKFKPMADFDWNWPTAIDRPLVDSLLSLDFLEAARNVVLVAPGGLGKTMIAKNIAHRAVLAGRSVLFLSAAQMLLDLGGQESTRALERRLHRSARQHTQLLAIELTADGIGMAPGPGTYTIETTQDVFIEVSYLASDANCDKTIDEQANAGSVTLDTVGATTVTGTFDVTFVNGDRLTGQWDAPVCNFDVNNLGANGGACGGSDQ
jgi:hypothetical protein